MLGDSLDSADQLVLALQTLSIQHPGWAVGTILTVWLVVFPTLYVVVPTLYDKVVENVFGRAVLSVAAALMLVCMLSALHSPFVGFVVGPIPAF